MFTFLHIGKRVFFKHNNKPVYIMPDYVYTTLNRHRDKKYVVASVRAAFRCRKTKVHSVWKVDDGNFSSSRVKCDVIPWERGEGGRDERRFMLRSQIFSS